MLYQLVPNQDRATLRRLVERYARSCDVVRSRFNVTRSWYEGYTSAKQKLKVYSLVLGTYIIHMITILIISTDNSTIVQIRVMSHFGDTSRN